MPKRSSKPSEDVNRSAFDVVRAATEANENLDNVEPTIREVLRDMGSQPEKSPAAQALGRLGGLKGGAARAKALTPEQRAEIAKAAAAARWKKPR